MNKRANIHITIAFIITLSFFISSAIMKERYSRNLHAKTLYNVIKSRVSAENIARMYQHKISGDYMIGNTPVQWKCSENKKGILVKFQYDKTEYSYLCTPVSAHKFYTVKADK